jgi:hypothetical protein
MTLIHNWSIFEFLGHWIRKCVHIIYFAIVAAESRLNAANNAKVSNPSLENQLKMPRNRIPQPH